MTPTSPKYSTIWTLYNPDLHQSEGSSQQTDSCTSRKCQQSCMSGWQIILQNMFCTNYEIISLRMQTARWPGMKSSWAVPDVSLPCLLLNWYLRVNIRQFQGGAWPVICVFCWRNAIWGHWMWIHWLGSKNVRAITPLGHCGKTRRKLSCLSQTDR